MQDATIAAVGRLLLAILFLLSGLSKLAAPAAATMGYIASAGLPFPFLGYVTALGVELGGGLLLLVGFRATAYLSLRPDRCKRSNHPTWTVSQVRLGA